MHHGEDEPVVFCSRGAKAEAGVRAGWDARVFLHNHTFDFETEKGMFAIAAPSESDLQIIELSERRLDIDLVWIIDGFNSFELDTRELAGSDSSFRDED